MTDAQRKAMEQAIEALKPFCDGDTTDNDAPEGHVAKAKDAIAALCTQLDAPAAPMRSISIPNLPKFPEDMPYPSIGALWDYAVLTGWRCAQLDAPADPAQGAQQADRSVKEILSTLRNTEDEKSLTFSAKEMRTALNLYNTYNVFFVKVKAQPSSVFVALFCFVFC